MHFIVLATDQMKLTFSEWPSTCAASYGGIVGRNIALAQDGRKPKPSTGSPIATRFLRIQHGDAGRLPEYMIVRLARAAP